MAREFVLLDNFYVESEVSADGHEWSMAAYATDFVERTWPLGYRGDRRVPYPAEGTFDRSPGPPAATSGTAPPTPGSATAPTASSSRTARPGRRPGPRPRRGPRGPLRPQFPSYDLGYPDVRRAERFLEELARFEREGEMPRLIILRLPNDHTSGTRPGAPTPLAMVADNDLALGMVIEGLSHSRFWPETAVFVVEDDAQNGPDHVDAHRTVALCISPYTRGRGTDSTMYSTSSMLRTIELILGLAPMSQFDAAARPMYRSFRAEPDATPYRTSARAGRPRRDQHPDRLGRRAVRGAEPRGGGRRRRPPVQRDHLEAVKGADSAMPAPVRSAFVLQVEAEDEDEEEEDDD